MLLTTLTQFAKLMFKGLNTVPKRLRLLQSPNDLCVQASLRGFRQVFVVRPHLKWHSQGVGRLLFRFHPSIIDSF